MYNAPQQPTPTTPRQATQAKTIAPPQIQDENSAGYVAMLVEICNDHIVKFHEYQYTDKNELPDRLYRNPNGNFRSDFERLYRATNLWLGYKKQGLTVKYQNEDYGLNEIFTEIEKWLGPGKGAVDDPATFPSPETSFALGERLYAIFLNVLVIADLYDPLSA